MTDNALFQLEFFWFCKRPWMALDVAGNGGKVGRLGTAVRNLSDFFAIFLLAHSGYTCPYTYRTKTVRFDVLIYCSMNPGRFQSANPDIGGSCIDAEQ